LCILIWRRNIVYKLYQKRHRAQEEAGSRGQGAGGEEAKGNLNPIIGYYVYFG
jgi:hypothetical protein